MSNVIFSNSYQILGLNITATQREIAKRSKEIINLIAIDESPEYELDFIISNDDRTESKVKEAAQNLSIPKKRIREYFFWFDIKDNVDEKAMKFVHIQDLLTARDIWIEAIEKNESKSNNYKKNKALLDFWILYLKDTKHVVKESIDSWKELIESDHFWDTFTKSYKFNDDINTNQEVINDFRKLLPSILSDIYIDLGKKNSTNSYLAEFVRVFGNKGDQLDKTILTPLFQKINNSLDKLDKVEIKSGETIGSSNLSQIKESIKQVQNSFNEIIELGLYDDSQSKILRDKVASSIRRISLDFNNNIFDYKSALGYIKIAYSLAGTILLQEKIKVDLETIESNVADLEITDVMELIQKQDFNKAIKLIDLKLLSDDTPKVTRNRLEQIKNAFIERTKTIGDPVKIAPPLFTIWGFGTKMYGNTLYLTALFVPVLPLAKYTVQYQGNGSFMFYGKLPLSQMQRIWFWVGLIIGGIFIISLFSTSNNSLPSSTNTNTSSYNDCSNVSPGQYCCSSASLTQAESIKPDPSIQEQLQQRYSKLNHDQIYLDSTNQNAVDIYNNEVDQYNIDKNAYGSKIDEYNNYLKQNCILK